MKFLCSLILLFSILSCKEKATLSSTHPQIGKDSNIINRESINPYEAIDVSPMDMSYLPDDYPIMKMENKTITPPVARLIYSRPRMQGRKIFGSLIKYNEPWRLGANEATELQLFQPVTIQKKSIPTGRYVLYCIPQENKWTIIFNGNFDCWGLQQDPSKDLYRFEVPAVTKDQAIEYFTMVFQKNSGGAELVIAWDNTEVRLPFQYATK